ncbi:Snf7 family [Cladochytrium replicatum]|nr:Snf7 family [Cladochytrium replicatum]
MTSLFSRAFKAKTEPKDAIVKLKETLDMLDKLEKKLNNDVDAQLKVARANASKNKRVAIAALKKKRMLEDRVDKLSGTRLTIETQLMAIESANINLSVMQAMKDGAKAMQNIHGSLNIDKVDATMDDIREQMDVANEIATAISQPVGFGAGLDLDEDELEAELDALEQEELDENLLSMPSTAGVQALPDVPNTKLPSKSLP